MAVNYPMPSWLHGGDPVGAYSQGASIGLHSAQLQQESALGWARLQQQAQLEAQKLASDQQIAERELQVKENIASQAEARHAQELAVEKAYRDAEIGLKQSALEQKTKQAALQFQGQQKFKSDLAALIDSGLEPEEAVMKASLQNVDVFKNPQALASVIQRTRQKNIEPQMRTAYADTGEFPYLVNPQSGAVTMLRQPQDIEGRQLKMDELRQLERKQAALEKAQEADLLGQRAQDSKETSPSIEANRKRYQSRQKMIESIDAQIEALRGKKEEGAAAPETTTKRFRYNPETQTIDPVGEEAANAE